MSEIQRIFYTSVLTFFAVLTASTLLPHNYVYGQVPGQLSSDQRDEVRGLVREYILENPEIITEAITLLQLRQEEAKLEEQSTTIIAYEAEIINPPEGTIIGDPDGDVTVVEFFDYNCGYCKSVLPAVMNKLRTDRHVRLVLKEFPILGPTSVMASKAALASRKQGKYSDFHQALMAHKGGFTNSTILSIAQSVGLDSTLLKTDMDDPEIEQIIETNRALARELQISGTPAFIIGTTVIPGAISEERLTELIENARNDS